MVLLRILYPLRRLRFCRALLFDVKEGSAPYQYDHPFLSNCSIGIYASSSFVLTTTLSDCGLFMRYEGKLISSSPSMIRFPCFVVDHVFGNRCKLSGHLGSSVQPVQQNTPYAMLFFCLANDRRLHCSGWISRLDVCTSVSCKIWRQVSIAGTSCKGPLSGFLHTQPCRYPSEVTGQPNLQLFALDYTAALHFGGPPAKACGLLSVCGNALLLARQGAIL